MTTSPGSTTNHEVDCRPSDALNLAVITGAPIRVGPTLLDEGIAHAEHHRWDDYEVAHTAIATEARTYVQEQPRQLCELEPDE